jgi:hypothetical protein
MQETDADAGRKRRCKESKDMTTKISSRESPKRVGRGCCKKKLMFYLLTVTEERKKMERKLCRQVSLSCFD